ncbi:hypothetical protein B0A49_10367 [Cryomyces minteri]|uniref:Uncharacterized protein n=1 Tax=Cryomyces minteri TaxID=331657 RepID=A0A4U0WJ43_9PEZI|nr:hypothetical protein B0A49_10367 [Cryomyces minteri]
MLRLPGQQFTGSNSKPVFEGDEYGKRYYAIFNQSAAYRKQKDGRIKEDTNIGEASSGSGSGSKEKDRAEYTSRFVKVKEVEAKEVREVKEIKVEGEVKKELDS